MSTTCNDCHKDSDGLMTCYYTDGETIKLCPTCLEKDGSFCRMCGNFSAGCESFDFSTIPGYCYECVLEIEANQYDEDEVENYDLNEHPYMKGEQSA